MTFNNEIEKTKKEIEVLTKKLSFLEEIEKQPRMTLQQEGDYAVVSYNDTTYYRLMGETIYTWYIKKGVSAIHPVPTLVMVEDAETERLLDGLYYNHIVVKKEKEQKEWKSAALKFGRKLPVILPYSYNELSPNAWYNWAIFVFDEYVKQRDIECGYTPNQKEQKREEPVSFAPKEIEELVKEGLEWCEDHPNENPLDWVKPQTPEETEESLKEAFREAQQTEKWKEIQKKIDDGCFNDFIFIDRPNLLDFLKDKLGYSTDSCYEIVDAISEWLPETQNASGSQNAYVESAVEGWNDCINDIRGKLQ